MSKTNLSISYSNVGPKRNRYGPLIGPWPSTDETILTVADSRVENRTSVNTPGYRSGKGALHRESLPMNPFSYLLRQSVSPYGFYEIRTTNSRQRVDGYLEFGTNMEPRGITLSDRSRIDAEATLAVLQATKQQRVNVGVTLGERKETSALILDAAKRLGTSYHALRKGDIKGALDSVANGKDASRLLRELQGIQRKNKRSRRNQLSVSSEILVVQLGWKPLLSDVYNYAELLAAKANDPVRTKVSASRSFRWSGPQGPDDFWNGVNCNRREFGIHTVKYVYYFTVANDFNKSLAELGITNPLSWLWELTALSFVFDWLLRVGDFVDALDATVGLTFDKGCKTTFEKCRVTYKCRGSSGANGENYVDGTAYKLHVDCTRTPLSGFPGVPPLLLGSGLSASRGLTASALIRQYFKR